MFGARSLNGTPSDRVQGSSGANRRVGRAFCRNSPSFPHMLEKNKWPNDYCISQEYPGTVLPGFCHTYTVSNDEK
jgi:hypothetical protein